MTTPDRKKTLSTDMNLRERVRKFRIKLLVMASIAIAPGIALNHFHSIYPEIDNNPVFISASLFYIFIFVVLIFIFLFMRCPSCNKGYFSEHGLPKLFYRLKCQSCGFNAFNKSHNSDART